MKKVYTFKIQGLSLKPPGYKTLHKNQINAEKLRIPTRSFLAVSKSLIQNTEWNVLFQITCP